MSDPLAEVIAMLNLRAVLTKTVEGAGDWRVIRSDQGLSFYGVVLEGGCRLEIDQHEPQILRAGDFILIPAAYRFALTSLTPPPSPALETIPVQLAEGHFRLGALDKPAQMQALIGHCASGSTNASLLASLLPAFVVVRNQPRLATFVGLLKEEAQADRAGKSSFWRGWLSYFLSRPSVAAERSRPPV
ncbi:AraC family transcriptional regulator [Klebsiella variicola]|nr:AraC family transcriptional regulator [Klebsiella variicola]SLW17779.1 AraC family transcriptional regulator [Klebsiella variicola]SLZ57006.1 AraC family transcriptional regulator [Klebsiella variicola]SLZ59708.1 AraC family transcriptional regulator [Klebsiella variicola]SLZ70168.1 AraC family transcriptional regulator [Klebsiella variicola]